MTYRARIRLEVYDILNPLAGLDDNQKEKSIIDLCERAMEQQRWAIAEAFGDAIDPTSDEIYSIILDTRAFSREEIKAMSYTGKLEQLNKEMLEVLKEMLENIQFFKEANNDITMVLEDESFDLPINTLQSIIAKAETD